MSNERRPDPLVTRADGPIAELRHPPARHVMSEIADGDTRELGALYDEFAPTVFGIIRQVLQSSEQSEKITKRAFIEISRTASQFDPHVQTLQSWICAVAHRQAVDELRHGSSQVRADDVHGQLDNIARRSIELAYYAGLTCDQIAAALAVGPEMVRCSIRAGLTQMRNARDPTATV